MDLILNILIGLGALAVLIALFILLILPALRLRIAAAESRGFTSRQLLNPLSWIEALPDGHIRLFVPKAEMGQGAHTGLAQIAVEELDIPWEKVEVVHASTHQAENKFRGTFGSTSISSLYDPLRQAAASMREMLRVEAALNLNVPPELLIVRDGHFEVIGNPDRSISYSALVRQNPRWKPPHEPVVLKSPDQFKVIGQSLPRVDAKVKVTGQAVFGQDARLEGMLYGSVVRPPTIEATMCSTQPGNAPSMPGVVKVVIEKGFAGVLLRSDAPGIPTYDQLLE